MLARIPAIGERWGVQDYMEALDAGEGSQHLRFQTREIIKIGREDHGR